MKHLRNEVKNHIVPHWKSQIASTTGKGRPVWAQVVEDLKAELAVEGEIDERKIARICIQTGF